MKSEIGDRIVGLLPASLTRKEVAARVEMTPDALSRALSGARGFSAVELARIANLVEVDVYFLITGEENPETLKIAARHDYDHQTGTRSVPAAREDRAVVEDIHLAYRQVASVDLGPSAVPSSLQEARDRLGPGFVRPFSKRLEACGIDIVRVAELSTAYSFMVGERAVIAIRATGNWFHENWSLAHELGHLVLGHESMSVASRATLGRSEAEANAFAADLLLPEDRMRSMNWADLDDAALATLVWDLGVSTKAVENRLSSLRIDPAGCLREWSPQPTQRLLRRWWAPAQDGDPITERMDAASARHFPLTLQDAHLELIALGRLRKSTLAWMLGVSADDLDVDEPQRRPNASTDELASSLGL